MHRKIDLHTHTNHSDGALSPVQLLDRAKNAGLDTIGIVDHDCVSGLDEAIEYGKKIGIDVIPGVELSTDIGDKEIHILGYFIDHHNSELIKYLNFFREERVNRSERIVNKLQSLGVPITIDEVKSGTKTKSLGRPHIADALVKHGHVSNFYSAFDQYLKDHGPAYERKIHVSPRSAIKLINDTGGLSFLAHPGYMKEELIKQLIEAEIDGIEVIHPSHSKFQIRYYRGIVNQYCLLESGGSDFHGGGRSDEFNLGKFNITSDKLAEMSKILVRNSA